VPARIHEGLFEWGHVRIDGGLDPVWNDLMLVVIDSKGREEMFQRALRETGLRLQLSTAQSGQEAIAYLKHKPPFESAAAYPKPTVIIVDIDANETDLWELLLWLQSNPVHRGIATVVLSGTEKPEHVTRAYSLGASAYIARPDDPEELLRLYRAVCAFWGLCVAPPVKG
jgi:CheY-like chemotaxis protein